jgi:hypothetical protein
MFFLMLVSFSIAIYFGYRDMNVQMSLTIISFLFFGVFFNLDRFEFFKLGKDGLEAKMVKLDEDIKYTHEIAKVFASLGLVTLSRAGNWGSISKKEKEKIKDELVTNLKKIGISDNELKIILTEWHNYTLSDYYINIHNKITSLLPGNSFNKNEERIEFENQFKIDHANYLGSRKSSKEVYEYLKKHDKLNDALKLLLEDYEYYENNNTHKSLERWLNNDC